MIHMQKTYIFVKLVVLRDKLKLIWILFLVPLKNMLCVLDAPDLFRILVLGFEPFGVCFEFSYMDIFSPFNS